MYGGTAVGDRRGVFEGLIPAVAVDSGDNVGVSETRIDWGAAWLRDAQPTSMNNIARMRKRDQFMRGIIPILYGLPRS